MPVECQTAEDVRNAERRIYQRRREFEQRLKAQRPAAMIVPPFIPPAPEKPKLDVVVIGKPRGKPLAEWVLENEDAVRSILAEKDRGPEAHRRPTIAEIQGAICDHYKINRLDLTGHVRNKRLMVPRHLSIALSRKLTPCSLPMIGRLHGGRDHTTVINAVRKYAWLTELLDARLTQADHITLWVRCAAEFLAKAPK